MSAAESYWCVFASTSSDGNTSGLFASFGSVFASISCVPLTGGTYATYAVICAAIFGSYTKFMYVDAVGTLPPVGMIMLSVQMIPPFVGSAHFRLGFDESSW